MDLQTLQEAQAALSQLKEQVSEVKQEWNSLLTEVQEDRELMPVDPSSMFVKKAALTSLQTEIKILKENLPKIVNYDLLRTLTNEQHLEKEVESSNLRAVEAEKKVQHWKSRHDAARTEYEKERQEKLSLKGELSETKQRVAMQSEYCAGMGAVCCTLLWRASQHQATIPAMLVGSQIHNFMSVVCHTLDSFVATYQEEDVPAEESEEVQFVLALCGTITNIAASASGRDYLASHSSCGQLIQTFTTLLSAPAGKPLHKLKNLILMALYNLSINQRGVDSLTKTKGIVPLLVWLLQEDHAQLRLHTLLLIQSLILENSCKELLHEIKERLTFDLLETLSRDTSKEVREVTEELLQVMTSLRKHEP